MRREVRTVCPSGLRLQRRRGNPTRNRRLRVPTTCRPFRTLPRPLFPLSSREEQFWSWTLQCLHAQTVKRSEPYVCIGFKSTLVCLAAWHMLHASPLCPCWSPLISAAHCCTVLGSRRGRQVRVAEPTYPAIQVRDVRDQSVFARAAASGLLDKAIIFPKRSES